MKDPSKDPSRICIFSLSTGKLELVDRVVLSQEEWQRRLSAGQYRVARMKGTEPAFSGEYHDLHDVGLYRCICCGTDLFASYSKFDSGTGWPSFSAPVHMNNVGFHEDRSFGMVRTEVTCARCDAHLGHVFDDGPPPAKTIYCINSASLSFVPAHGKNRKKGDMDGR